ncbi:hypothetical protein ABIB40_000507 [Pedobacter sp. UYP30]|uniref:hypothetical protein n=1 Tax=Pedobacter sp. UYP30 TaxID=1756400 RepID=UPI00339544C0
MMIGKRKITLTAVAMFFGAVTFACPVCDRAEPKIFRGLVHGGGPNSNSDYIIIAIMTILVLLTLFYSVKFLVKPGERSTNHIKRTILFID